MLAKGTFFAWTVFMLNFDFLNFFHSLATSSYRVDHFAFVWDFYYVKLLSDKLVGKPEFVKLLCLSLFMGVESASLWKLYVYQRVLGIVLCCSTSICTEKTTSISVVSSQWDLFSLDRMNISKSMCKLRWIMQKIDAVNI